MKVDWRTQNHVVKVYYVRPGPQSEPEKDPSSEYFNLVGRVGWEWFCNGNRHGGAENHYKGKPFPRPEVDIEICSCGWNATGSINEEIDEAIRRMGARLRRARSGEKLNWADL